MKNNTEVAMASEPMVETTRAVGKTQRVDHPPLDTKSTGGVMGQPIYADFPAGREIPVSLNYDGGINQTASGENLSAKYKNPNVKESVRAKGQNQYE